MNYDFVSATYQEPGYKKRVYEVKSEYREFHEIEKSNDLQVVSWLTINVIREEYAS
jgi:hypothetical protein